VADRGAEPSLTPHRFFLDAAALTDERIVFPEEQAHQIKRVLRLRAGERVVVLDGRGGEATVRLDEVGQRVTGQIMERRGGDAEPRTHLTLYQGLLKAAKVEWVWQKCTEIGVSTFVPVMTQRAVPGEPNPARQHRFGVIVREAAEQSRRAIIPAVSPPLTFADAIGRATERGPTILLWEDEPSVHLASAALPIDITSVNLFVGPEGGFSLDEVALARQAGVQTVTLGRRILRAETAAVVSSALLLARLGDLG
jgi:16S rRNA (uracil1498-N3)-methyltransferase